MTSTNQTFRNISFFATIIWQSREQWTTRASLRCEHLEDSASFYRLDNSVHFYASRGSSMLLRHDDTTITGHSGENAYHSSSTMFL